jgi:5-methylcytosine-specific restriction endonuclease McrA
MLTFDIFKKQATKKWDSLKGQAAAKRWKSGKRAGQIRKPAVPIHFTKDDLLRWLWKEVGLNTVPCSYCRCPLDIISLRLDHKHPKSAGGEFSLENLQFTCDDDNQMKGEMTHEAFVAILEFARTLSPYDQGKFIKRLKAAHHGSMDRFGRDRDAAERKTSPPAARPAQQSGINFDLGTF